MWYGAEWVMRTDFAVHLKPIISCAVDTLVRKRIPSV